MHERFAKRIEEALDRLGDRIQRSKKALDRGVIERQIGRLLQRNSRAAGGFSISITEDDAPSSGLKLTWEYRPEWQDWARLHAADIVLPFADTTKSELRLRCVVRPDREQAILLQHLGLMLPERLRSPPMPQM